MIFYGIWITKDPFGKPQLAPRWRVGDGGSDVALWKNRKEARAEARIMRRDGFKCCTVEVRLVVQ